MAKYERGTYEPEDVRVFDGGADDEDTEGSHLPMVIVISLLVLAAFGGVVWLAYNNGVAHGRADVPAHAVAQNEAPAVAPGSGGEPAKAIKVYQQPAGSDEDADQQVVTPAPAQLNKVAAPVVHPQAAETKPAAAQAAPVTAKPVPPPAMAMAKKPVVPPPVAVAQSTLPPVKTQPKPAAAMVNTTASGPPASLSPAKAAAAAPAATGAFVLQIGAYKSEADANASWKVYQAKHAALLSGVSSSVQRADLGDKGVWYRLRAGSYADKDAATAACDKLKADGGACFPAK